MQKIYVTFTKDYWFGLSTFEQLMHIGDDVEQAINARKNGNTEQCENAIQNALELLELTIIDPQNIRRLSEITNIKPLLLDDFYGKNEYQSTDSGWIKYFACFKHLVNTHGKENR